MSRNMQELEKDYIRVKSEIRVHIMMIKAYTENIQKSKGIIDGLSKELTDLQQEYAELKKEDNNEQEKDSSKDK